MEPPRQIDGARVLEWAWSDMPFGEVAVEVGRPIAIYGLALCQYEGSSKIYRLSCNAAWESQQDQDFNSIAEAKLNLPIQHWNVRVVWHKTVW